MKFSLLTLSLAIILFSCGKEQESSRIKNDCISIFDAFKEGDQEKFYTNFITESIYFDKLNGDSKNFCIPQEMRTEVFEDVSGNLKSILNTQSLASIHLSHICIIKEDDGNFITLIFQNNDGAYYEFPTVGFVTYEDKILYTLLEDDFRSIELDEKLQELDEYEKNIKTKNKNTAYGIEIIPL